MINSSRPLEGKIALFWHSVLCTGFSKVDNARQMTATVRMFRRHGLGSFRDLLTQLALDPGLIYYLDNCISHQGAINENWARELLELFSMGVGNYTEEDVKQAARAFTGWTVAPTFPFFPYNRLDWQPVTARFIARHMCDFFVADEAPVTQWTTTRLETPRPSKPCAAPTSIPIATSAPCCGSCSTRTFSRTPNLPGSGALRK